MPCHTSLLPLVEPLQFCSRFYEELHLHLLKLTHTEDKLSGDDLITESLTDLCDTERNLHTSSLLYVQVIYKDTLCSLRTQINLHAIISRSTHLCREHQVKLAYIGPVTCSADRADDLLIQDNLLEFFQIHGIHSHRVTLMQGITFLLVLQYTRICCTELSLIKLISEAFLSLLYLFVDLLLVFGNLILYQHISTIALLRITVVNQGIVESIHMTRCLPYRRMHKDSRVDTHDIVVQQHHTLPPILLDIIFQFYTILSVVVYGS